MRRLDSFQRCAVLTTLATYFLIAVGAFVRAREAGLGCPDWPKCFDRWIPPTDKAQLPPHIDPGTFDLVKAWTEYTNRMIGVLIGFLIFGTLVLALRRYRGVPRVLWPTVAAFLLVGFQGWLGGQVVAAKLRPVVVSIHLGVALLIVSLLLYATTCAFFPQGAPLSGLKRWRYVHGRAGLVVAALILAQVVVGALVRGEVQLLATRLPLLPREEWFAELGPLVDWHQSFAVVVAASVVTLALAALSQPDAPRPLRIAALTCLLLLLFQVLSGFGLKGYAFPRAVQVAHLGFSSLLLGVVMLFSLLSPRVAPC